MIGEGRLASDDIDDVCVLSEIELVLSRAFFTGLLALTNSSSCVYNETIAGIMGV